MSRLDRDAVLAQLTPEAVAEAYGLTGRWFGRWMRSKRCAAALHGSDAFALSRDGKWHCWACDVGGDLLALVAACEGKSVERDFGDVLEIAAGIAGVSAEEDDWGAPAAPVRKPTKREPPAPDVPLVDRLHVARARCEWVWSHLKSPDQVERVQATGRHWYLATRGLHWADIPAHARVNVRDLGFWTVPGAYEELGRICALGNEKDPARASRAISSIYNEQGVAVAVRHVETGNIVDIRARRAEPAEGAPKILGMPGGVCVDRGELVACYGNPHRLDADLVIVAEGWADWLTAAWRWPKADVLGAVDAGQYPLVAAFAARYLAERGRGRLVLVAQDDGDVRTNERGQSVIPAAKRAVEAALKRTIGMLGPDGVSTLDGRTYDTHDLNDLVRAGRANELPEEL